MASNEDLLFVELALKRELVTQEQVDEILALQAKLEAMGLEESVADLMVKKGVLAETDARSLTVKVSPKGGGQQIEGYRLLERVGRGGMGSVYKGVQLSMGRLVALKVLSPALTKDEKQVARLRREAQLVGKLQHPNIVQGVDHGVSGGFHYFAMEYVDGESVRDIIGSRGIYREKEALRVVTEVTRALAHAHGEGVVHRDVKPGNILVARDGKVKLADYGLAKGPLEDIELTQSGVTVGTPQYISPEQARGPSGVDIRTDIYSLGATLYHMVTGRPPYEGETLAHLIQQVLYEPYAPPQTLRRNLTKNTAFLIEKMMARHPRHRYQSPRDLLLDLEKIEAGKSIVPSGWQGDIETFYMRRRLRRWVVAAVVVIVVGLSATFYTAWRNRNAEQKQLEEAARQAFAGVSDVEVTPENLSRLMPRLLAIAEDYEGTEGADLARRRYEVLRGKKGPLDHALSVREELRKKSAEGEYRAALEALQAAIQRAEGESSDLARRILGEAGVEVLAERTKVVRKGFEDKLESLLETAPREALGELRTYLFNVRRKAFLEDESAGVLTEGDELVRTLDEALSRVDRYLADPRERLESTKGVRNYLEIEQLRAEKEAGARGDPNVRNLLSILPGTWSQDILEQFEALREDLLAQNVRESEESAREALALAEANRFAAGEKLLGELEARSLPPVADTLLDQIRGLVGERGRRETTILELWAKDRDALILELATRQWSAAHLKLDELMRESMQLDPSPLQEDLPAWRLLLDRLESFELDFINAIDGQDRVQDGLTVRAARGGRIREIEVLEVRVEGSEIFFRRKPGGEELKVRTADVSVADLKRLVGDRLPRGDPLRPMMFALLDLGELMDRSPQEREIALRTLKTDVEGVARVLPEFRIVAEDVAAVFETEIMRATGELALLEHEADKRFKQGEEHVRWERWQEAYDAFNQLLTDRRFKNTKFVKDRDQTIRDLRAKALRNLSSVRLGEHLGGRVRHLDGPPVGKSGGETVVAVDWVLDSPAELERFEYDKDRIGIVDQKMLFVGPPGRDWAEGEVRTVEDRHLRFHPQKKPGPDYLNLHPLKLQSPLMYSREIAIEFRARWERPLALLVSLCGTNLLVLSSTERKENGRGVHIWQGTILEPPLQLELLTPEALRASTLASHPEWLKGEEAHRRYFQFEPDRWYKIRFVRGEMFAFLFVGDQLVYEQQIKQYGPRTTEIRLLTYTPMRLDDLSLQGTVDGKWYRQEVKRDRGK